MTTHLCVHVLLSDYFSCQLRFGYHDEGLLMHHEEGLLTCLYIFFFICFSEPEINEETVKQLQDMGFPREGCRKAVYHTKNTGVEPAMNWVFQHMGDAGESRLHL